MSGSYNGHSLDVIFDCIYHSVIPDTDTKPVNALKLYRAIRTGIVLKQDNMRHYPPLYVNREFFDFAQR